MCINNIIFSKPYTHLILFLSFSTCIHNCIMVYASLACISVAMMSPIESFGSIKGERFRFHLQTQEVQNRKFSLSNSTEINIKGRSGSPSNCLFGELGKTWEATKYKRQTLIMFAENRPGPARFLELNSTARSERAARPVQTSGYCVF